MKAICAVVVLIAAVAADVSHLNNMYLPPKGGLSFAASEQHQQQSQYVEQSDEAPQVIGANTFTPAHLSEPSNSLAVEETAPQPLFAGSNIYPRLQEEDLRVDLGVSQGESAVAQAEPQASQHQEVGVEARFAEASQNVEEPAAEEQQPAAQEFVPQTYGTNIIYGDIPEAGLGQQPEEHYETAASSSGIDTQYGSNGGYVY